MVDQLKEIWKNLSKKHRIGVISIILIILLWLLLSVKLGSLKNTKQEIGFAYNKLMQESIRLKNANKKIKEISTYQKQYQEIVDELKNFENQLILENELINLTNILTFKESDINYRSFGTNPMIEEKLYRELPIKIILESTYLLLGQYLKYIEESSFIVSIDKVSIEKQRGSYNRINVNLDLMAYVTK